MGRVAVLVLLTASLFGCRSTEPRYYLLHAGQPSAGAPTSMTVGVGPVGFPEYLDRVDLVERRGQSQIRLLTAHLWAEPLATNFSSILVENMRGYLGSDRVLLHPWNSHITPNVTLELRVERFDTARDGAAVLRVQWTLSRGPDSSPEIRRSEYRGQAKDKSVTARVRALSELVLRFAKDLSDAVRPR